MKIAIDGFTLGLREGTGLSTFAYELAETLGAGGHDVSAIYGLTGLGADPRLRWPRFIQRLGTRGEALPDDWLQWAPYAALYAAPAAAGWPLRARQVGGGSTAPLPGLQARVPSLSRIYNLPSIYYTAHSVAVLFGRQTVLQRLPGTEVFHRTSPLPLRMRGVANVTTVHDVIPLALPHSTAINLSHYRRSMEVSLRGADALFVVSEHSRRDLLAHFDVPEERIVVTYQSVRLPEAMLAIDDDELARRLRAGFDLAPGGYFLFFGAIEPKKNVLRLLDAHALTRSGLPLVVAGRYGWLYEQEQRRIAALQADPRTAGRIRRIEYLPFAQLMLLLKGARALVFPSLYEGFGLPVLEAMTMGVPVVTSNCTALPEVAGDAALLVDPLDPAAIARAMDRLAGDETLRADLVRKGQARAQLFTPQRCLERLEQGYRLALGRGTAVAADTA